MGNKTQGEGACERTSTPEGPGRGAPSAWKALAWGCSVDFCLPGNQGWACYKGLRGGVTALSRLDLSCSSSPCFVTPQRGPDPCPVGTPAGWAISALLQIAPWAGLCLRTSDSSPGLVLGSGFAGKLGASSTHIHTRMPWSAPGADLCTLHDTPPRAEPSSLARQE